MSSNIVVVHLKEALYKDDLKMGVTLRSMPGGQKLHGHDYFEIDFVLSGKARSNINGKEYELEKNSIIFLTPADIHDYCTVSDEPLTTYSIAFTTDMKNIKILSDHLLQCRVAKLDEKESVGIRHICESMLEKYNNDEPSAENIMRTGIEWIILMMMEATQSDTISAQQNDSGISTVLVYIFENFTKNLTRDEVAKTVNLSPMYFSRYFHKKMGISFQNYVLELRLEYARRLLSTVDSSIVKVAAASGFNSMNYFSHAFSKRYGISPGKYAAQNRISDMKRSEEDQSKNIK